VRTVIDERHAWDRRGDVSPPFKSNCRRTDTGVVKRRFLLPLLLLGLVLAGCGNTSTPSGAQASRYRPPPRQQHVLPDSLNIHGCSSTTMAGGLVAVCDPVLLQRAWENHTLNQQGDLDVRIAGRKVRVASTPGLTQVIPDDGIGSLLVPAKVTLDGKASDGSYLYISARSGKREHAAWGEALFRHLGLDHGGIATIDVGLDEHGAVRFTLRRADGSTVAPLRFSHLEGPGPAVALPRLPDHYADTPEQGTRTYVAAINARDGRTICQLWTREVRKRFGDERTPCWALATGLIDYGSESDSPLFERLELLHVGNTFERTSRGVTFTAVPVSLRSHSRASRYSSRHETRDSRSILWLRHTSEGWRIAKDPFFTASGSADAPPGASRSQSREPAPAKPSREELDRAKRRAKEAEARAARQKAAERAREKAAWGAALVRFRPGSAACQGRQVRVADAASDVLVQGPASAHESLRAAADIRSASLAVSGRHVCFSVSFASQPFGTRQPRFGVQLGLGLMYQTRTPPSVHQAGFAFGTNVFRRDRLIYAGLGGASPPQPAATHAELRGKTLVVDFDLDEGFPSLRPSQLGNLTWGLDITVTDYRAGGVPTNFHDQVPNNPHPDAAVPSPEVRQSDGKTVTPG
jgi:hypothetical protein